MFDLILRRLENTIIAVTFLFITLLAFANVVARYVFHASFSFTSELLVNLAVLLTMVGASAATRLGTHPSFSLLRDSTRGALHKLIIVVVCLAMLAFYAVFLWLGWDTAMKQFESGRLTPALQLPQGLFSLALPLGALLGTIRTIQVAVIELRGGEAFKGEEAEALEAVAVMQAVEQPTDASQSDDPVDTTDTKAGDRS
ncbi:TRAP transporter small permease [Leucobacter ruminantium]|uniref:TRAP transporter small permease n=1 Tax=Leucobacter ruminantium TaxID=1289170 RepID=A0A939LW50_9MICO|nr:TRAP transporter small permease [Leucobacter ruminantium]MBO1804028.1 TRAP transporter small permease [Leucobacter ruminantium]